MSCAWRSFLSRSRPLLFSSFRPARSRRHGSQLTAVLGSNNLIGSRGHASNSSGDTHDTAKRHLYMVLDDHKDGFGIHKLDLGDHNDDTLDGISVRRLPETLLFRVTVPTLGEHAQFAAVGNSIVGIGTTVISPTMTNSWLAYYYDVSYDMGGVLIYDTKASALTVAPHLPEGLLCGYKAAMAVENSLYMIGPEPPLWDWNSGGSLHCLTADPSANQAGNRDEFWGWEPLSDSWPWCWSDYRKPPGVPFSAEFITAHAAHASPAGAAAHELLVSVRPAERDMLGATFSFNTASRKWTQCGEWLMPFLGQAHYNGELDAWVGLHAVNDENMYGPRLTNGHICVGNIMSIPAEWKVCREKLFRLEEDITAGWRHVDAKLVPMETGGGGTEYCLMERLEPEGGNVKECLMRLTAFRVERAEDGEPVATARRPARSYSVSRHIADFDAQAFWM